MSWFIDVVSSLGVLGMSTGGWLSFSQESKVKNTIGSKHSFFMKGLFRISKIKTFITAYKNCLVSYKGKHTNFILDLGKVESVNTVEMDF